MFLVSYILFLCHFLLFPVYRFLFTVSYRPYSTSGIVFCVTRFLHPVSCILFTGPCLEEQPLILTLTMNACHVKAVQRAGPLLENILARSHPIHSFQLQQRVFSFLTSLGLCNVHLLRVNCRLHVNFDILSHVFIFIFLFSCPNFKSMETPPSSIETVESNQ